MGEYEQKLRLQEHQSLRNELSENKKYIFERPLIIITSAAVAAFQFSSKPVIVILPLLFIVMIWVNLSFTVNRLKSNARIAAYIEVALENSDSKWIGWESSLRRYRLWMKENKKEKSGPDIDSEEFKDELMVPDANMFYKLVFLLHILPTVLVLLISGYSCFMIGNLNQLVATFVTILTGLVFLIYSLTHYQSGKMNGLIEERRVIWKKVLGA